MRKDRYYTLTFPSTHDAMTAERALRDQLPLAVMPTLRQISASCGISLRIEEADWPRLGEIVWDSSRCKAYHVGETVEPVPCPAGKT